MNPPSLSDSHERHHEFRLPFNSAFRVSSSTERAVRRDTKVSAIDVTPEFFFQRLYWFQDWAHFCNFRPESTVRVLSPHCSHFNYFSISVIFFGCGEGTGTRPDYLVNYGKKNEGPFGEKNCTEIEKEFYSEWLELWVHTDSWLRAQMCPILEPNKRSKNFFSVTSIALSCAHICTRLLQPLLQSLIGSPGTLDVAPHFLSAHDPPSNLAESRYPPRKS